MLRHMSDAERIFAYRALRFSRNDKTPLNSFDENAYAPESNASAKSVKELGAELVNLRKSTIDLFESFPGRVLGSMLQQESLRDPVERSYQHPRVQFQRVKRLLPDSHQLPRFRGHITVTTEEASARGTVKTLQLHCRARTLRGGYCSTQFGV